MSDFIQVKILEVCPSPYGYAVFLKAAAKIFVIYMDRARGISVQSALNLYTSERPLSHEFFLSVLDGFDCKVRNVVIYHVNDGTFYTKINLEMFNELGKKIIEVDGRPSDTLPMAIRANAPVFIPEKVLKSVADVTDAYKKIKGEL